MIQYEKLQMEGRDMVELESAISPTTVGSAPSTTDNYMGEIAAVQNAPGKLADVTASSWGCIIITSSMFFVYLTFYDGTFKGWIIELNPLVFVFVVLHVAIGLRFFTLRRDPGFLDQVESRPQSASEGQDNVPLRYCQYCNMYQPRRTRHCKQCEKCILTFDHHCFWIGGCVGERNTCAFIQMLFLLSIALTWYYPLLGSTFVNTNDPFDYLYVNAPRFLIALILFGFWMMVIGLFFYHMFLAFTAQTTWENIRRRSIDYLRDFPREVLPFSNGALDNLQELCCREQEGYIKWKYTWVHGDAIPFSWFENEYWSCC
eukprot:GEMP01017632.1.p1 GENE.GEMP01017632.1~~GEMP01017632.1.p1  ORF type:complete len:316 (+),score=46.15 GEMP01017632.1:54-1001(+)